MGIHKKNFFEDGWEDADKSHIEDLAFEHVQNFVEDNPNIRVINITHKHWSNGEEYTLYYEDAPSLVLDTNHAQALEAASDVFFERGDNLNLGYIHEIMNESQVVPDIEEILREFEAENTAFGASHYIQISRKAVLRILSKYFKRKNT